MPYTRARLEHALRIFRENPSNLIGRGLTSRSAAHNLRSYHLRSPQKIVYDYDGPSQRGRGRGRNSDDEDYDPSEERRRLNAAAKRKKVAQKRKAEVEGDAERTIKKSKLVKAGTNDTQTAYVTLKITSEEGKKLFRDLATVYGSTPSQQQHYGEVGFVSSYWDPQGADTRLRTLMYTSDAEKGGNDNDAEELTIGLRNGKVPNKQINRSGKSKSKNISRSSYEEDIEVIQDNPTSSDEVTPVEDHRQTRESSIAEDLDIDISDGALPPEQERVTFSLPKSKSLLETEPAKIHRSQQPELPLKKIKRVDMYTNGAGLESMETHYAHPINFHSFQTPCDFCGNYRMGVIGLGKKVVSVYPNPSDPTKLEEAGNGFRAEGYPETQMCTLCGLKRLMIARCHAPEPEDQMSIASSRPEAQFTYITGRSYGGDELNAYIEDLFDHTKRPFQFKDTNDRGVELPSSCSLCPCPAVWRCCRLQQSNNATDDPCSILPVKYDYKVEEKTINGKKRDVVCLDSDTEEDVDQATSHPPAKRHQANENRTPTPIRFFSQMTSTNSFQSPVLTRPKAAVISGCGFKLCNYCKVFLDGQCDGKLHKAKVWKYLRNDNKFGPRADVQFLFHGSDLQKAHAHARDGASRSRGGSVGM